MWMNSLWVNVRSTSTSATYARIGILVMPKIDGGHKKYHLTPEI